LRYSPKYIINENEYGNIVNNIGLEGFGESYDVGLNFTEGGEFCIDTDYFPKDIVHLYWISNICSDYNLHYPSDCDYFVIYPGEKEIELVEFLDGKLTYEEYIIQSIIK
jgi:hypothetical protein